MKSIQVFSSTCSYLSPKLYIQFIFYSLADKKVELGQDKNARSHRYIKSCSGQGLFSI